MQSPQSFKFIDYSRMLREMFLFLSESESVRELRIVILIANIIQQAPKQILTVVQLMQRNSLLDYISFNRDCSTILFQNGHPFQGKNPTITSTLYFSTSFTFFFKIHSKSRTSVISIQFQFFDISSESAFECLEQCQLCFGLFSDTVKEQIWDTFVATLPDSALYFRNGPWDNWEDMPRLHSLMAKVSKGITGMDI